MCGLAFPMQAECPLLLFGLVQLLIYVCYDFWCTFNSSSRHNSNLPQNYDLALLSAKKQPHNVLLKCFLSS